jgi:RimJ/RimL family protein N-acetyltransferase
VEGEPRASEQGKSPYEFIGLVTLTSLDSGSLALPEYLASPAATSTTTLILELAYLFLPTGWGRGFATESVTAVFEACKSAPCFWTPFSKVYVRAIVNEGNPASMRVMDKTGMIKSGVYNLTRRAVFLAGEWREQHSLHIFGRHLLE